MGTRVPRLTPWATLCRGSAPPGGKAPHAAPDHVQFFPPSLRPCGKQSPSATPRPLPLYSYSYSARRAVLVLDPLRGIPSSSQDLHWPEYEYQYEYENHIHAHTPTPQSLSPLPGVALRRESWAVRLTRVD